MMQEVLISDSLEKDLAHAIAVCAPDKLFVLTDETTKAHCWPKIHQFDCVKGIRTSQHFLEYGRRWEPMEVRDVRALSTLVEEW